MDLGVISVRYARALLKGALENGMEDAVYNDMQCIANCYLEVPELRATIDNPMLPKDKKRQLLFTAAGTNPTDLTERFLTLVIKERRANALQFMATSYVTLYRQHKHIIQGRLVTASPATPAVEKKMQAMVERRSQGTVEFTTEVDPDIIGGFILEYDTYRMDASVKTRLRMILSELT